MSFKINFTFIHYLICNKIQLFQILFEKCILSLFWVLLSNDYLKWPLFIFSWMTLNEMIFWPILVWTMKYVKTYWVLCFALKIDNTLMKNLSSLYAHCLTPGKFTKKEKYTFFQVQHTYFHLLWKLII